MEVTKELLESFTKNQLLEFFPSLEIKEKETKVYAVESILTAEPTDEEKEGFKKAVETRDAEEAEEKAKAEADAKKAPAKIKKKGYIVVHRIKHGDTKGKKVWEPGEDFTCKHDIDRYMDGGQIRLKD